jgi:DNA repair photolyase
MFVRWEQQTVEHEAEARLPGYRDVALRHFDAPEAVDTRFYEVHAKTILNRVPESSQVPFRWTINPYRGCSHACAYCTAGDTRILLADGTNREMRELKVGDRIVGTVRDGRDRRLVETTVEAKWSSLKPAFAIALSDGTQIVTSGDHRFLSDRGWKHVTGAEQGALRRPHLTLNNLLLGPGGDAVAPVHGTEYRRGYLCAMVRGDANLGSDEYSREGRQPGDVHGFRLALTDVEALDRTRLFLWRADLGADQFRFSAATGRHREVNALGTQRRGSCEAIRNLIQWPTAPSEPWTRGFLAGIFDAEGGCDQGVLRIANTDEEMIRWTRHSLERLGFRCAVERSGGRATNVRLLGGISERLRFFHSTDPAITRKRSVLGAAIMSVEAKRVVSITPLGKVMRMYDITTGTEDFIANGVIAHNCFARPTHEYLGFNAGRDFDREIVVKVNAPERLRAELARPSWLGEHVALGTNTDPYQWVEGRYELMRGIWEAMVEARNPCSVLTKSPLLLRDLDLMQELTGVTDFSAALSIPTLDPKAWRATEPHSPNPKARLEAVAKLTAAGIPTGVLVAPLMPGINDSPAQVREVVARATDAGAVYITGLALHLRGSVREVFMEYLAEQRPELVPQYEDLYRRGAYLPREERRRLSRLLEGPSVPTRRVSRMIPPPREPTAPTRRPRHEPDQASLF